MRIFYRILAVFIIVIAFAFYIPAWFLYGVPDAGDDLLAFGLLTAMFIGCVVGGVGIWMADE